MTETIREFVAQEYRTDDALPPIVRALVARGRKTIAAAKAAEEAAVREQQEAARARAETWLGPVRTAVGRAVPAELHSSARYPVDELTRLAAEYGDDLPAVKGANDLVVTLLVPGCREIKIPVRRDADRGWYLVKGYEFQTGGEAFGDLSTALAFARDAYLESLDIPL